MGRRIAIVGNGSFAASDANSIERCDLVVRFNDCRSIGRGGLRTDVVAVCNTGRPARAMVCDPYWRNHVAVASASSLWSVRDSSKFAELKLQLAEQDASLKDFCDDYTDEFAAFAAETAKAFSVIPRRHHDELDRRLRELGTPSYIVPSSGLVAISFVIDSMAFADDSVVLAGFDHQGWPGHPFDAERVLVEQYIDEGRLSRLGVPPLVRGQSKLERA